MRGVLGAVSTGAHSQPFHRITSETALATRWTTRTTWSPLTRDDVCAFLDAGHADAIRPRPWTVDGYRLAALDGRPVFCLGLQTPPKPVGPFDRTLGGSTRACISTRRRSTVVSTSRRSIRRSVHLPGHNLLLGAEIECERIEETTDSKRLRDADPPRNLDHHPVGQWTIGHRRFAVPEVEVTEGLVDGTLVVGALGAFAATAAVSVPVTGVLEEDAFDRVRSHVLGWPDRRAVAADRR